jgi:hypothetical protein
MEIPPQIGGRHPHDWVGVGPCGRPRWPAICGGTRKVIIYPGGAAQCTASPHLDKLSRDQVERRHIKDTR